MPKPRYDEEKDETRPAAVSEEYCEDIHNRPLAKVKNSPPSVPPRLRGEARKIRLPPLSKGRVGEGSGAFLQEV